MRARTGPPRRGAVPGWSDGRGRVLPDPGWLLACRLLPFVTLADDLPVTVGLVIRRLPSVNALVPCHFDVDQPSASFTTRPKP